MNILFHYHFLFFQKKEVTEYLSLGADINYMEVMLTCTEQFIIDAVS